MRTLSFIALSAALVSTSAGNIQAQAKDSVLRAGVESVLGSLERSEKANDSRAWSGERGREGDRGRSSHDDRARDDRGRDDRGKYDSKRDRREREKAEARWRKQQEHELRSCEKDLWSRVRRERARWDDDRYVRSTRDRIRRICEQRVYGRGVGWGRIFDR